MNEIKKIELITEIETDNKTVLFNHIQENEEEFEEVKLSIEELDSKLENIQLTPGAKGDKGDKGDKGEKGNDGLNGKDGENGRDGLNGLDGRDGVDGKDGEKGEQGEKGDKPKHRWKGTQLQFEKPDGTWGQLTDLRGLQGQIGLSGGSLGASYPGVKLNNELLTTGAREFNFSGGITASVVGTSVTVETEPIDLSGYVPYTGANQTVNLNFQDLSAISNLSADSASISNLTVDFINIDANVISSPAQPIIIDSATSFTTKLSNVIKYTIDSDGFHIGSHGGGASTAVPLFLYDNYGAGVKIQTTKMANSNGYNAIFPDLTTAQEDFYFLFGTAKGTNKKVAVYTEEYGLTSWDGLGFNSAANTLTVGDTATQGSIEIINSTRTLTLRAPSSTYTFTFPAVPATTQTPQLASTGIMTTITNTGSGNNVLATSPTLTTPSITTSCILTRTALGSTPNYGLYLRNTTASTSGNPVQFSPAIQFFGSGWDTDAGGFSEGRTGMIYLSTATGADVTATMRFDMDEAGGSSDTKMYLRNNGCLGLDGASAPVAKLAIGGNGISGTGLYVGSTGYSYAQVLVSDGDGEEIFKVKDYLSDNSIEISFGDVGGAFNSALLQLTYNKLELTYADFSIVDNDIILGTTTGTKIGTSTSQKLGFYNATPVDQPATVSDPTGGATVDTEARTAINSIIDRLQELGLIA